MKDFANIVTLSNFQKNAISPADGSIYYFGPNEVALTFFAYAFFGFTVSRPAVVTDWSLTTHINGTSGSSEPSIFSLMEYAPVRGQIWHGYGAGPAVAKTNEYILHKNVLFVESYGPEQIATRLNIELSPYKIYLYKWQTPTWVTNPASIYITSIKLDGYYQEIYTT
jgi:hypothetical protein